jgi:hypothetical protein
VDYTQAPTNDAPRYVGLESRENPYGGWSPTKGPIRSDT